MKTIYVVFSATPYKMGRFIRTMLRNKYNHVSLAFEEDLASMYSFARFHKNIPLYGGFVSESLCRHFYDGRSSRLKICRIEVPDDNYRRLRGFVAGMENNSRRYIYNTYSAILSPLHIRLLIRDSYTCAEFVGDALSIAGLEIPRWAFHSLPKTERLLEPYVIYEGSCEDYAQAPEWGEDRFPERLGKISAVTATLGAFARLTYRAVLGLITLVAFQIQ